MKYRTMFIIFAVVIMFASTGCSKLTAPTYPKDNIPDAIRDLCRKEYNINDKIDIKITGKTLGVRINLERLLDKDFKLNEEALDKIQNLLRIIRRVCLSTDADLDFYVIIGRDTNLGIEVVFYSYVTDLQKAVAGWMSPEDYFERLIRTMRLDTLLYGRIKLNKFVNDIQTGNMIKVIANNFALGTKIGDLDPEFLKVLTDLGKKEAVRWHIEKQYSTPVGFEEHLHYIEAKEYYTPKQDIEDDLFYPSGTTHKFYILFTMQDLNPAISGVYSKENLPDAYTAYGHPQTWKEDDFFLEDLVFHEFIATQIVQRIRGELTKGKKYEESDKLPLALQGDFIIRDKIDTEVSLKDPSNNIFELTFMPDEKSADDFALSEETIDLSKKAVKEVCNKYKFYDIGELIFQDNKGRSFLTLDKLQIFDK